MQTLAAACLSTGQQLGFLDAKRHDRLTAWVRQLGYGQEIQDLVAGIERRP